MSVTPTARLLLLLASALLGACAAPPLSPAPPPAEAVAGARLAILGATVIDGTGRAPRPETTILIEGDRIRWMGPASAILLEPGTPILDAAGRWVIPGLFDAHVHLASVQTPAGVVQEEVQKLLDGFLLCGVTSILDAWGTEEVFELRRLEREGRILSPRIHATGPGLTAPGAHGTEFGVVNPTITSIRDAKPWIARLAALRADLVKVAVDAVPSATGWTPSLDRATFRAIVDEAHRNRLRIGVHALHPDLAMMAMQEGADVLLHAFPETGLDDQTLRDFGRRGGMVVAALSAEEPVLRLRDEPRFLEDPFVAAAVDPRVLRLFGRGAAERFAGTEWERAAGAFPSVLRTMRRLRKAGIELALGTDASNLAVFHGPALHREAELMVRAGFTPDEVLTAATRGGPRALGLEWTTGTLAPGRLADLVILERNPLEDVANLRRIVAVVKGGRPVDLRALAARVRGTVTAKAPSAVFADFEDGPQSRWGSQPFAVIESGPAPHSEVAVERVAEEGETHLRVSGTIAEATEAFAGVAWHLSTYGLHAVDLGRARMLRFRVRGDGQPWLAELITLDSGQGAFVRGFRATAEWSEVEIRLDRLRPLFLERDARFDPARAMTLRFVTAEARRGPCRLELDDIRFGEKDRAERRAEVP